MYEAGTSICSAACAFDNPAVAASCRKEHTEIRLVTGSKYADDDAFAFSHHRFLDALTEIAAATPT
jgi:hypothetical protein